jgi:hypothetical protein
MKSDLNHLPQKQQDELALIRTNLRGAFEAQDRIEALRSAA